MAKRKRTARTAPQAAPHIEFQARCDEHDWDSHWQPTEDLANQEAATHTSKTGHADFTMVQRQMSFHSNLTIKTT